MNATSNENHRTGPDGPASRELPILFHLMDVSRPRPEAKTDHASVAPVETPVEAVVLPAITSPPTEIAQFTLAPTDFTPTPLSIPTTTWPEPVLPVEAVAITSESATASTTNETDSPATSPIEPPPGEPEASDLTYTENAPAATPSEPVTLKSKTSDRRKRKTPASEDWFASHGKFIAIGFVVALIGTVYLARTSRQQATPSKTSMPTQSPLVDIQPPASSEASPPPVLANNGATKESPTKAPSVSVVSDSKVELQPPTTPQLIAGPATEEKPLTADKLFDFPNAKKSDERIASRPKSPSNSPTASPPSNGPSSTPAAPATAPPAPTATMPELAPAYPSTSPQAAAYPVTTPANSAYSATSAPPLVGPAAAPRAPLPQPGYAAAPQGPSPSQQNYRSQFPVQSTPPSQAWPPPTGTNVPGAYQPLDNTARGQRNERTGSGNY